MGENYSLSPGDDNVSTGPKGIMVSMVADYMHYLGLGL